jgi:hypothetical protein
MKAPARQETNRRCVDWPPKHDRRMILIADREKEATRMKPGERGEGEIDVPNLVWTSFWRDNVTQFLSKLNVCSEIKFIYILYRK